MKIYILFIIQISLIFSTSAISIEAGKWEFVKADEYCYVGSQATETDLPENKKRGDYYILVYKNIGSPDTIVQIEAGYDYKIGEDIIVNIDKGEYLFYTTEDLPGAAWTNEDSKVIFAMKKGLKLIVTGESARGTTTNDTYTLNGFTAAYNKLVETC